MLPPLKPLLGPIETIYLSSATLKAEKQLSPHFGPGFSLQIGESCAL